MLSLKRLYKPGAIAVMAIAMTLSGPLTASAGTSPVKIQSGSTASMETEGPYCPERAPAGAYYIGSHESFGHYYDYYRGINDYIYEVRCD